MTTEPVPVFVGWDSAQAVAYDVLRHSILRHARRPVVVRPIRLDEMERVHGFRRPRDPLQSTEFTYTRFLVPLLMGYRGVALFLDSDMLALGDLTDLFDLDMSRLALRVVKRDHQPAEAEKMGGKIQTSYPRKNWSSMMLMNAERLRCWTREAVETRPASWLHRFEPIPDVEIGEIDGCVWNVLDRHDERTKLVHYTSGGPWLTGYEKHPYGRVWFEEKERAERVKYPNPAGPAEELPEISVWRTSGSMNQDMSAALALGIRLGGRKAEIRPVEAYDGRARPSISYGIMRGTVRVYSGCRAAGADWWNVDRGYFRRSRGKDGTFKVGYRGLQPEFPKDANPDPSRWESLRLPIEPWRPRPEGRVLICPPTIHAAVFYGIREGDWIADTVGRLPVPLRHRVKIRRKDDPEPVETALRDASLVVVYNSNLAVEALRLGIPAIAEIGVVRSWNGLTVGMAGEDQSRFDRERLFHYAASCQFTFDEIQSDAFWPAVLKIPCV